MFNFIKFIIKIGNEIRISDYINIFLFIVVLACLGLPTWVLILLITQVTFLSFQLFISGQIVTLKRVIEDYENKGKEGSSHGN